MTAAVAGAGRAVAGAGSRATGARAAGRSKLADTAGQVAVARAARAPQRAPARGPSAGRAVGTAAGFVLGLVFWGWVVMPFISGGPERVRDMLRAKFLNKGPGGEWLP